MAASFRRLAGKDVWTGVKRFSRVIFTETFGGGYEVCNIQHTL